MYDKLRQPTVRYHPRALIILRRIEQRVQMDASEATSPIRSKLWGDDLGERAYNTVSVRVTSRAYGSVWSNLE